jgi:prolyl-tRNA editing enzyme YbaK/EbsC (Cys-tRNA(Pro) deacylase)
MAGGVERVRAHLESLDVDFECREFDRRTKNSALAASALGCSVAEIAKSVVFRDEAAWVIVISGDKRVDTGRLSAFAGRQVQVATAEEVRELTGYPIGGVPPFPHLEGVRVLCDDSLRRFERVWAAGGAPNVVFRMAVPELVRSACGCTVDVSERR